MHATLSLLGMMTLKGVLNSVLLEHLTAKTNVNNVLTSVAPVLPHITAKNASMDTTNLLVLAELNVHQEPIQTSSNALHVLLHARPVPEIHLPAQPVLMAISWLEMIVQ